MCFLRKDAGTCYAYMPSWFYNKDTQKCEEFIYGGCGGNANRFATEADCQRACSREGLLVCRVLAIIFLSLQSALFIHKVLVLFCLKLLDKYICNFKVSLKCKA